MRKQWAGLIALGVLVLGATVALVQFRCASSPEAPPPATVSPRARDVSGATASTPPPSGSRSVRGRVVDLRGQPVAGVEVSATRAMPGESLSQLPCDVESPGLLLTHLDCSGGPEERVVELIEEERGGAPVLTRVTTAADGTFQLDSLPEGTVALWALGERGAAMEPEVATGREDVELVLEEGLPLSGRVLDEAGVPLSGVRVTLFHQEHSRYFTTSTDADGRFSFGLLPVGAYGLVASSPGLLPAHLPDVSDEDLDDIVLHPPRRIVGQVLLADGRPAPGAEVQVQYSRHVAVTDGEGRFAFEPLAPGEYEVLAERDGAHGFANVSLSEEDRQAEASLTLGTLAFVEGLVRDEAGHPVAGASVTASSEEAGPSFDDGLTGADGRFRMGPLPLGTHTFSVDAEGYHEVEVEKVEVSTSGAPLTFTLRRAFILAGLVTDAEGRPVPDVSLEAVRLKRRPAYTLPPDAPAPTQEEVAELMMDLDSPLYEPNSATSDEEGRFLIEVPEAGRYLLTSGGGSFLREQREVDAPARDVQVVLHTGATLEGTVVDARGAPLAYVQLFMEAGTPQHPHQVMTSSDEQGTFALRGLPPGTYTLKAGLDLGGFVHRASRTVSVRGTETVDASLRMDTGLSVSGLVVDGDGRPVPEAQVEAYSLREKSEAGNSFRPSTATTGPDGRFTVDHVVEGECALVASKEGHTFEEPEREHPLRWPGVVARSGARDVRLVLRYQGYLHGRVVRRDGTPIPRFSVNQAPFRDPGGAFRLPMERAGTTRLLFEAPGLTLSVREVEVPPGRDLDLGDVRLEPGRQLRGRVVDAETSLPVALAEVRVNLVGEDTLTAAHSPLAQERTGADGSFVLPLLERRPMDVDVLHDDFPKLRQRIGADDELLELRLPPGARLEGTLTDREGQPVLTEVYLVSMSPGEARALTPTTTSLGTFQARGLTAGEYMVTAEATTGLDGRRVRFRSQHVRLPATGRVTLALTEWVGPDVPREEGGTPDVPAVRQPEPGSR
ncbi:carboxypeptidase-like regulatory domain-containing protein [Pyxidicoccus trucidator]|uniref:carboxypeptidase-like regulatory domain-containing protein n=1 Tax=Pyxidicoccus trucidator TaxID=2709662 RepID=UPI0013DBD3B5|nr:carboxypeptidase-like regulatory domain-containing protein [Pyxidicoccus trucidator]